MTLILHVRLEKVASVLYTRYSMSLPTRRQTEFSCTFPKINLEICSVQGQLPDGTVIAVKQLSSRSRQGNREFLNEVGMISCLQHPNLVKLHGCCIEGDQLMLVYEYMVNNSLSRAMFGELSFLIILIYYYYLIL